MQISNVVTIFRKELTDTLRDRRTLVFMLLVPIVAIPLLMMGMSKLMISQITKVQEETSKIVITGREWLPSELDSMFTAATDLTFVEASTFADTGLVEVLQLGRYEALVAVPDSFATHLQMERSAGIEIKCDRAELRSEQAEDRLVDLLDDYRALLIEHRLTERDVSVAILEPFEVNRENVAPMQKMVGEKLGMMLPYLIIIMCFMGAMYPAIDLTAGEKERGTLETLLVSPAARIEFVMGKYMVVVFTGLVAALLSLGSLVFSMKYMVDQLVAQVGSMLAMEFEASTIVLIVLVVLPLVGIFAGVLLSVSIFARSFKEAQSYVTALNMAVILPAFVSILPGVELDYTLAMIPVVNASLIMKEAISGSIMWEYVIVALLSNSILAALSLVFCKKWFERESVIFRM